MGDSRLLGRHTLLLLPLIAVALLPAAADAKTSNGKVKRVVDGDSVQVTVDRRTRTYHLRGVEAPELRGDAADTCYGTQARSRLRRLLRRRASVRLRTSGRSRQAEILRRRTSINRSMVRGGYARAKRGNGSLGRRLRRDQSVAQRRARGLWRACAGPGGGAPGGGTQPPAAQPGDVTGQAAIDQLGAELSNAVFRQFRTQGDVSDSFTLHLCGDRRFRFVQNTTYSGGGPVPVTVIEKFGNPWTVVEALIRADGSYRGARVTGTFTQRRVDHRGIEPTSEPAEAVLENRNGQWYWGGQAAEYLPGQASCDPAT